MEAERNPPQIAKKFWKILRIVVYMMNKSIGKKSKQILDLQTLLKRGKSALTDCNYYSALTCRSNDGHLSFISPREYEFSCSNTPAHITTKRKNHNRRYNYYRQPEERVNAVQKVLDLLNRSEGVETSPYFSGFRRSPCTSVRQLRVTDSPFPPNDTEAAESCQVDKDCEDFINEFYKSLKKERIIAALESPSPCHLWAG